MPSTKAYLWHYAPFLRLLIPLMTGIIFQWYLPLPLSFILIAGCLFTIIIILYFFLSDKRKYQFNAINGFAMNLLLLLIGAFLIWAKDIRHNKNWLGNRHTNS